MRTKAPVRGNQRQIFNLLNRRTFLSATSALAATAMFPNLAVAAEAMRKRPIPSTGEEIPVVGMGSWGTLNVGDDMELRAARLEVVRAFLENGGGMIDSSPMYGSSEDVIGYCLENIENQGDFFSATKVWTRTGMLGRRQMNESFRLWRTDQLDLMQIHNLMDWETHLETLLEWKAEGRIRYIGITTSHGRRHAEFAQIMSDHPIDFVQLTYNVLDREAENVLLPLAAEKDIAVIVNRPFQRRQLFNTFAHNPLPDWASEFDCQNWAQFFLKFIVSHPSITCAIPATTRIDHALENIGAGHGSLPDNALRKRMVDHLASL